MRVIKANSKCLREIITNTSVMRVYIANPSKNSLFNCKSLVLYANLLFIINFHVYALF